MPASSNKISGNKSAFSFLVLLLVLTSHIYSQPLGPAYVVYFKDKANSPYSVDNPSEFLTNEAISRRQIQNIPVQEDDIPVNSEYLELLAVTGAQIAAVSRWFNMAAVWILNPDIIPEIEALPFVLQIIPMNGIPSGFKKANWKTKPFFDEEIIEIELQPLSRKNINSDYYDYGQAATQIEMINGKYLHNLGFCGEGIIIAVLDAGFRNVDINPAFDSLRANNRILGTRDFVVPGNNVYNPGIHIHGANVLSIMAANIPGQMVGTAPEASYWLLRTEDADGPFNNTEYLMEEYYWIAGAEFADSVGAYVINSSLGYTTFDNPSQNHSYADMDGNTTPITLGANKAAEKGMLVVNSAGNSGNLSWKYISAPADGLNLLAVGAVKGNGSYASFSSIGPSADGRVKPDITARGDSTTYVNTSGQVRVGNGTSYSSPVIAGMTACLWQSNKNADIEGVYQCVIQSASQYQNPDVYKGYGIPDFEMARFLLTRDDSTILSKGMIKVSPNPAKSHVFIETLKSGVLIQNISICDLNGRIVIKRHYSKGQAYITENVDLLNSGLYILRVDFDNQSEFIKLVKF